MLFANKILEYNNFLFIRCSNILKFNFSLRHRVSASLRLICLATHFCDFHAVLFFVINQFLAFFEFFSSFLKFFEFTSLGFCTIIFN